MTAGTQGQPPEDSLVDLVGKLARQGSHLAQEQLHLVQAELHETSNEVKEAVAASLAAVTVGVAGLGVLLMGIAYYVGDAVDNIALGTVIVGAVTLVVAAILYAGARRKLAATQLKPRLTIETARTIPAAATGNLTNTGA